MKAKRALAMLLAAVVMVSGTPAIAQASSYQGYSLPRLKGNKYTSLHDKTKDDDYIKNKITALTDTTYVNTWAVTSGNDSISNKYKQGVGTGEKTLYFTSGNNLSKGDEVGLGMENYQNSTSYAWVSGEVNFY